MDVNSIEITIHALDRFRERKKGKTHKNAKRQIQAFLAEARELIHFKNRTDGTQFFINDPWCFVIKDNRLVTLYYEGYITRPRVLRKSKHIGFKQKYLRNKISDHNQKWKWR